MKSFRFVFVCTCALSILISLPHCLLAQGDFGVDNSAAGFGDSFQAVDRLSHQQLYRADSTGMSASLPTVGQQDTTTPAGTAVQTAVEVRGIQESQIFPPVSSSSSSP